jgi:hypothetical protein
MRTRTATLGASLLAVFTLAVAGSLAGAAAPADAYYLSSTKYSEWRYHDDHLDVLRFPEPRNLTFMPCITRKVTLQDGYWKHNAYVVSTSNREDPDINLKEESVLIHTPGTYKWKACRWWGQKSQQYFVESTLSRGSRTVDESLQELSANHIHDKSEGKYEWGGRIVFDRAFGITEPSGD